MLKSIEAVIESDGRVRLKEHVRLDGPHAAIVIIIDEPITSETALLSETALAEDWTRPEEDEAWSHLKSLQPTCRGFAPPSGSSVTLKGGTMGSRIAGAAGIVALVLFSGVCLARPVQVFDYDKMTAEADLVAIATPVTTKELKEKADLPGVSWNNQPIRVVGLETTFEVSVCFKGKLPEKGKPRIVLHHYRLENPRLAEVPNAVQLLQLKPGDRSQYLMFLKCADDGRYEPFNGQTDPVHSVEKLRNPKMAD